MIKKMHGGFMGLLLFLSIGSVATQSATQEEAKDFALPDSSGRKISLSQFKGKVVLLDFWATWCGPCKQSMPHLQRLHRRYSNDGLVVIGINTEGPERGVLRYIEDGGYTFIMLFDKKKQVSRNYRVRGIPHSVLIDQKGRIQFVGHPLRLDERELKGVLESGLRDRRTGRIIAGDVTTQKEGGKKDEQLRAAKELYEDGKDQKSVGNFGRAAEFFLEAIETHPSYLEAHKEYINMMRQMNKQEELVSIYREWITEDSENAVLHYALGLALDEKAVVERQQAFRKALSLDENLKEARLALESLKR